MMRILSNILSLILVLFGIGIILLFLLPQLNKDWPANQGEKIDTPMPTTLHPLVDERKEQFVRLAEKKGIDVVITDGYRSVQEQNKLYQQGRSLPGEVVTNAKGGNSYHNYGLAIDFALRTDRGEVVWDMERDGNGNGKPDWMEAVQIAKDLGFEWGGDWESFTDYPHLQMDFGLTIRELKNGKRPEVEDYTNE